MSAMSTILAAVDFTGITTWQVAAGVAIIGIALAFKGIVLGKRGIKLA